jgi:hypothetical protein
MNGNAERRGDVDDGLGHVDVRLRRRRLTFGCERSSEDALSFEVIRPIVTVSGQLQVVKNA